MSLADIMKSAAAEAQGVLAELGGAKPRQKNFVINGVPCFGVLNERTATVPATGTGYEVIAELVITATQDQFTVKPPTAPRSLVSALGRNWYLVAVGDRYPLYELTCRLA